VIRLTRISKQPSGPTTLEFETGDRLEIPSGLAHKMDLEEGENYSLGTLEDKIDELTRTLLPEMARKHLARYPKTSAEFLDHYERKGFPKPLLESILKNLREQGFIDDQDVARRHIERRLEHKHYGRYKILSELREKGIPRDEAERLLQEHYPPESEREQALEYADDHSDLERRTLASRLEQRGFSSGIISEVLNEVF
jgi:SOS response regulatory protein OraA/RecX